MNFSYLKYVIPRRRGFQAMGRTVNNQPRVNRVWPELSGMSSKDRREYGRLYMRIRRMES